MSKTIIVFLPRSGCYNSGIFMGSLRSQGSRSEIFKLKEKRDRERGKDVNLLFRSPLHTASSSGGNGKAIHHFPTQTFISPLREHRLLSLLPNFNIFYSFTPTRSLFLSFLPFFCIQRVSDRRSHSQVR
ncbi:hypothetical protein ES332_A06G049000v1 [Gossypium tomentosum]|uniref:Uncharacterized protein n=2 Tax=Gossypium TaxID=3633 RepID=A0A5D2PZI4_GOSTO|nr:hypothetical protein ES332_A06G049000v1 [Gossypium tomentosum]